MATPPKVSPKRQSAFDELRSVLKAWGLPELFPFAMKLLQQNYTGDEAQIELEQTKEFKQRFKGNELREAAGMDRLSPAQYIALEDQYRQLAKQYGLSGHYYGHDYMAKLIGGDISPSEFQSRAQIALQTFTQADQETKDYWSKYGLTAGDAVSAIMDTKGDSLAGLQLKAQAVQLGGAAAGQGIDVSGQRALQIAENGTTLDQARAAYQRIAQMGATDQTIAKRYGLNFNQQDEENDLLLGKADAGHKRQLMYSEEAAQFSGHGGLTSTGLDAGANY